ncbi:CIS tube protein [Tenacibaculum xiamenense]|uniref:CIS tube protein n=1 Tax=Tenacibaculum xiamenense TaxID=1261553 RepID=UPI003892ED44
MASLELLKITGFKDKNYQSQIGDPYSVMINPSSIKLNRSVEYNAQMPKDSSAPNLKFKGMPAEKLNFDIVIDCTGIVDGKRITMSKEIGTLEKIVYTYNGNIHRPNYVKVQWGDISFNGVLTSFNTSYTLFKPDGSPLRAKVSLAFDSFISAKERKQREKKSSPDMTHIINVVQGDSLPNLCYKVWNSTDYYVQVAAFNNLNKFRHLKGGEQLIFPPIEKESKV